MYPTEEDVLHGLFIRAAGQASSAVDSNTSMSMRIHHLSPNQQVLVSAYDLFNPALSRAQFISSSAAITVSEFQKKRHQHQVFFFFSFVARNSRPRSQRKGGRHAYHDGIHGFCDYVVSE